MIWTFDTKASKDAPWVNQRTEHRTSDDAWRHLTWCRLSFGGEYDYYAACVRSAGAAGPPTTAPGR